MVAITNVIADSTPAVPLLDETSARIVMAQAMTVTECLDALNNVLHTQVVIVEGEVSTYNVSQGRWVFFSLRDNESLVECFAMAFRMRTPLEEGMTVRVTALPGVHKKSGRFRLTVDSVELVGEGALQRAFELLKEQLANEGLFSPERKRSLPRYPQRIALVASPTSAAYTDFLEVLGNRWGGVTIDVVPVSVQGEQAVGDIVQAFAQINESVVPYDAVVLTRGGGSLEDLHAFNDERVARAIARSRVPVLCGVGHERDVTIADMVADVRAATPSNAAEILVPARSAERQRIMHLAERSVRQLQHVIVQEQFAVRHAVNALLSPVRRQLQHVSSLRHRSHIAVERLTRQIVRSRRELDSNVRRIFMLSQNSLKRESLSISQKREQLRVQHPRSVLSRGYSIVRGPAGAISRVADVVLGQRLQITVLDGSIDADVISKKAN